jgi:hypothetical protein
VGKAKAIFQANLMPSLIRKKTLALAYLATFEPMKISPALDNRIDYHLMCAFLTLATCYSLGQLVATI